MSISCNKRYLHNAEKMLHRARNGEYRPRFGNVEDHERWQSDLMYWRKEVNRRRSLVAGY